jgi:hypothetical protein
MLGAPHCHLCAVRQSDMIRVSEESIAVGVTAVMVSGPIQA